MKTHQSAQSTYTHYCQSCNRIKPIIHTSFCSIICIVLTFVSRACEGECVCVHSWAPRNNCVCVYVFECKCLSILGLCVCSGFRLLVHFWAYVCALSSLCVVSVCVYEVCESVCMHRGGAACWISWRWQITISPSCLLPSLVDWWQQQAEEHLHFFIHGEKMF